MSLKKKVVHGLVWTMLQGAVSQLISFLVFLVLARLLDPENFGLVAMATVSVAFFRVFKEFGFGAAIIQRENLESGHLDTAFWTDILVNVVMMTITFLSAEWVAMLYSEARLEIVIQALSLLFLPSALGQVQTSILRRNLEFRVLAIRTLTAEVIGGVTGIACALSGFGVWSIVARQLTTAFTGTLILWILSSWRPGLKFSRRHFNDLFGFSVNMFGASLVGFVGGRSDAFLIGYFLGPVTLGYYTIAHRFVKLLIDFLGGQVNRIAWPAFARLQDNPEKIRSGFYLASQILALVVMPVFLGIFSVAPELVPLMFGAKWEQSIPVLKILVFGGIINSMNKMYNSIIVSVGRPGVWLSLRTAISISNALGFFIALRWGLTGVALAYVIVAYAYLPVYLYTLNSLIDMRVSKYFGALAAPIAAATLMACSVLAIKMLLYDITNPGVHLFILIAVGVITYCLSLILISPATIRNLLDAVNMLRPDRKIR